MGRASRNPDTGLTDKEEKFSELMAFNPEMTASDAYRGAYDASRMKPTTISTRANTLRKSPRVAAYILKLREERIERTKIDADYVLRELKSIQELDVIDILNDDGSIKPISMWPKPWRLYISGFDISELFASDGESRDSIGFLKKIKWPDKVKNLELIGKHIDVQAFKERVESTNKNLNANVAIDENTTPADAADIYKSLING